MGWREDKGGGGGRTNVGVEGGQRWRWEDKGGVEGVQRWGWMGTKVWGGVREDKKMIRGWWKRRGKL